MTCFKNRKEPGSSLVEHLPGICEALGSNTSTKKPNKQQIHIKYIKYIKKTSVLTRARSSRIILFFVFVVIFWDKVYVAQAGLELSDPLASACWVLGLQTCSTMPSSLSRRILKGYMGMSHEEVEGTVSYSVSCKYLTDLKR